MLIVIIHKITPKPKHITLIYSQLLFSIVRVLETPFLKYIQDITHLQGCSLNWVNLINPYVFNLLCFIFLHTLLFHGKSNLFIKVLHIFNFSDIY